MNSRCSADLPFQPPLVVEPLIVSVGIHLSDPDGGRRLLRLAAWQALEVAAELDSRITDAADEPIPGRCGWRGDDGGLLIVAGIGDDAVQLLTSSDGRLAQVTLTPADAAVVAEDLRAACELLDAVGEAELVRAAIEGWA